MKFILNKSVGFVLVNLSFNNYQHGDELRKKSFILYTFISIWRLEEMYTYAELHLWLQISFWDLFCFIFGPGDWLQGYFTNKQHPCQDF